ncbi:MAG: YitT family protein [Cellulosilyticaceae bacterium]
MYTWTKKLPIKTILMVILGASILSFGTFNFNYQNNITEGGVLGLLLLFKNLFNISPSITNIILDFSLFCLGARFYGKSFLLYSALSTISFSASYRIWEALGPIAPNLNEHMLLASILAGLFVGVGVGIVVRAGGASGGDDVIALLVSKFTPLKVNWVYMITDFTVLILSLSYLEFEQIFYSLIAVTISGKLISIIYKDPEEESEEALSETLESTSINANPPLELE